MKLISTSFVTKLNIKICLEEGNGSHCYDPGKIDSALHTAFYPGSYPFAHGGVSSIAGALAFYLTNAHAFLDGNKRTAVTSSLVYMRLNGLDLQFPEDPDALADTIEGCAAGNLDLDDVKKWYEVHKVTFCTDHKTEERRLKNGF